MSWSKVKKGKKPLIWWFHKIMCEIAYYFKIGGNVYYYHLDKLCNLGFNLYGEPWKSVGDDAPLYDKVLSHVTKGSFKSMAKKLDIEIIGTTYKSPKDYGESNIPNTVNVIDNIKKGEKLKERLKKIPCHSEPRDFVSELAKCIGANLNTDKSVGYDETKKEIYKINIDDGISLYLSHLEFTYPFFAENSKLVHFYARKEDLNTMFVLTQEHVISISDDFIKVIKERIDLAFKKLIDEKSSSSKKQ